MPDRVVRRSARNDNGLPRACRNPNAHAFAHEIITKPRYSGIGHNMPIVNLRIDQFYCAEAGTV